MLDYTGSARALIASVYRAIVESGLSPFPVQPAQSMSSVIQEIFLESEWQDEDEARTARDGRVEQLQAQGFVCTCENLFTVFGQRVFLLTADRSEAIAPVEAPPQATAQQHLAPRLKRSAPPKQLYEIR